MNWLCAVIGHKWRPSRFVEAIYAGAVTSLTGIKLSGFCCARCGKYGLA